MDMLDFICNGSVDLFGTGRERKIQNENICLQRDSNPHPASPRQESCSPVPAINLVVRELNSELSTNTLHFHLECIRCAKAKGKKPRYYTKTTALQDGVHPTKLTSLVWVKRLLLDAKKCCTLQGPFDDELELNVPSDELEQL